MIETSLPYMPFANTFQRDIHFAKHGHKFGAADPTEYERLAEAFLFGPLGANMRQCFRAIRMDRVRYEFGTQYEGVACTLPQFIRTFFPVNNWLIAKHGGEVGYFRYGKVS